MAKNIDVAFIQSCDWDRHIELSKPFIDAGVPVFIDKPIVGNMHDVKIIEDWAKQGKVILGIEEAEEIEGVTVFHAGTARNADGELVTAGGRVLNVVALGDSFDDAREKAYEACDLINFEGKQYRSDIGKRAAAGRAAWEN